MGMENPKIRKRFSMIKTFAIFVLAAVMNFSGLMCFCEPL